MLPYHGADIDFSISGKTAIITGGAAGIGKDLQAVAAEADGAAEAKRSQVSAF